MSLLFNMQSSFAIAFLTSSKHLLFLKLQSPPAVILEPKKIKSLTISIVSPSICHEMMGLDTMILAFWMLFLEPTFSLTSFIFISSLLSAVSVVSSSYLRLLIFLLVLLIPTCDSSRPALLMMYSEYKLNQHGDNIQPWSTLFPIWNQAVLCLVLTVAAWPAYSILRRKVRCSAIPISLRIFHRLLWSTQPKASA